MSEVQQVKMAEKEMSRLTKMTGKACKVVTDGKGNYAAVVIGSCEHFKLAGR